MAQARVLVSVQIVQYLAGLIGAKDVARDLVFTPRLRYVNQFMHPIGDGVDVFTEADEVLDAGHIGLEGDGLNLLEPPLLEFLDLVAGQRVQRLYAGLIG